MERGILYILLFGFATACGTPPSPKPEGYLRIDLPEKSYRLFDSLRFPYRFECPVYARVAPDVASHNREPYWLNIHLPEKATIHFSYKRIKNNLPELLDDTHNFVYRHVIKASAITETPIRNREKQAYGMLYEISGEAASSVQFYVTDSVRHFVRGALYFMDTPNYAYLSPMISYYTSDIEHLIETFQWK
ncbi:MAG: gliding motility lipoprotein GldD [Prevotellaceae bacterium]|jgi:gliding motility-associated lipoprotein GldD|nr:gliding motility lipoprotein GldD [Prevotellaceae bacterium]